MLLQSKPRASFSNRPAAGFTTSAGHFVRKYGLLNSFKAPLNTILFHCNWEIFWFSSTIITVNIKGWCEFWKLDPYDQEGTENELQPSKLQLEVRVAVWKWVSPELKYKAHLCCSTSDSSLASLSSCVTRSTCSLHLSIVATWRLYRPK